MNVLQLVFLFVALHQTRCSPALFKNTAENPIFPMDLASITLPHTTTFTPVMQAMLALKQRSRVVEYCGQTVESTAPEAYELQLDDADAMRLDGDSPTVIDYRLHIPKAFAHEGSRVTVMRCVEGDIQTEDISIDHVVTPIVHSDSTNEDYWTVPLNHNNLNSWTEMLVQIDRINDSHDKTPTGTPIVAQLAWTFDSADRIHQVLTDSASGSTSRRTSRQTNQRPLSSCHLSPYEYDLSEHGDIVESSVKINICKGFSRNVWTHALLAEVDMNDMFRLMLAGVRPIHSADRKHNCVATMFDKITVHRRNDEDLLEQVVIDDLSATECVTNW